MDSVLRMAKSFSVKLVKESPVRYSEVIGEKITSAERIRRIAVEGLELHLQPTESFFVITLDTKNKITGIFEVSRGTLNTSIVHPRDVFQRALLQNANAVILMHNHPSGDVTPSSEDISLTNRLANAGEILGIQVLDHIIVSSEGDSLSFMEDGLM